MRLIHRRRFPVNHYVLVDDLRTMSPERLMLVARQQAEALARRCTGNPQGFTLIHNGAGVARCADPHVHIVCTRSRTQKGLVYLIIGLRNLFPASLLRNRHAAANILGRRGR